MKINNTPLLVFRWIVVILAVYFAIYYIVTDPYENFAGPFRKLTNWAVYTSGFVTLMLIRDMRDHVDHRHEPMVMVAATVNLMVIILYWQLYLEDPALVHDGGKPDNWPHNLYLHLFGPLAQIIDALFFKRAFRRFWRAILPLWGYIAVFSLWGELVLQPFSTQPVGSVTSGLPYPFLNSMEPLARAMFYSQNALIAAVLMGVLAGVWWVGLKIVPPREPDAP